MATKDTSLLNKYSIGNINRCRKLLQNVQNVSKERGFTVLHAAYVMGQYNQLCKKAETALHEILVFASENGIYPVTQEQLNGEDK